MTSIDYNYYVHNSDRKALEALEAIPGFKQLVKAFLKVFAEKSFHLINMSENVRLSKNQLPNVYKLLPPICEKLGIDVPELYMEYNPYPNAYTVGDSNPLICITTGALNTLNNKELVAVLAHECGHIACRHCLYHTIGTIIFNGISIGASEISFRLNGMIANIVTTLLNESLAIAFSYWMRCSEFSCDRAAAICTGSSKTVSKVMLKLAGKPNSWKYSLNHNAYLEQAKAYDREVASGKWDKMLHYFMLRNMDHPLNSTRALDIISWGESEQYKNIIKIVNNKLPGKDLCPYCYSVNNLNATECCSCGKQIHSVRVLPKRKKIFATREDGRGKKSKM